MFDKRIGNRLDDKLREISKERTKTLYESLSQLNEEDINNIKDIFTRNGVTYELEIYPEESGYIARWEDNTDNGLGYNNRGFVNLSNADLRYAIEKNGVAKPEDYISVISEFDRPLKKDVQREIIRRVLALKNKDKSAKDIKEAVETYYIKYWKDEESRDQGESDIYERNIDKKTAIDTAKRLVDRGNAASVEVIKSPSREIETEDDIVIFGYDGEETWGDEFEESLTEDKKVKFVVTTYGRDLKEFEDKQEAIKYATKKNAQQVETRYNDSDDCEIVWFNDEFKERAHNNLTIEEMFNMFGVENVFDKDGYFTPEALRVYDKVGEKFFDNIEEFDKLCDEEKCFKEIEENLKEEYEEYKDELYCDEIADRLEDGYWVGYTYNDTEWELEINGLHRGDFSPRFADYLAEEVAYPVRAGYLSYIGLDMFIAKNSIPGFHGADDAERLIPDLIKLGIDKEIIDDWLKNPDADEELEFWVDYDTNFDVDQWEENNGEDSADWDDEEYHESLKGALKESYDDLYQANIHCSDGSDDRYGVTLYDLPFYDIKSIKDYAIENGLYREDQRDDLEVYDIQNERTGEYIPIELVENVKGALKEDSNYSVPKRDEYIAELTRKANRVGMPKETLQNMIKDFEKVNSIYDIQDIWKTYTNLNYYRFKDTNEIVGKAGVHPAKTKSGKTSKSRVVYTQGDREYNSEGERDSDETYFDRKLAQPHLDEIIKKTKIVKESLDNNTIQEVETELKDMVKRNPREHSFNVDTEEIKDYVKERLQQQGYEVEISGEDRVNPNKYHIEYYKKESK